MADEKKPATSTVAEMKVVKDTFSAPCSHCYGRQTTFALVTCCRNEHGRCNVVGKCPVCKKESVHPDMSPKAMKGCHDKCTKQYHPPAKKAGLIATIKRLLGR